MINLRYHIVSITAVFLALGIGLTLGSTFLDRVTVDTLKNQLDTVQAAVDASEAESALLQDRLSALESREEELAAELPERLVAGHLEGVPVLLVAADGTPEGLVERAAASVSGAGADLVGSWELTSRWALDDDEEVRDLSDLLDLSTDDAARLRRSAAIRLADVLMAAVEPEPDQEPTEPEAGGGDTAGVTEEAGQEQGEPDPPATPPEPEEPEVAATLEEAGFLDYGALPAGQERVRLPVEGLRVLIVSTTEPDAGSQEMALALLDELTAEGPFPAVAAQGAAPLEDDDGELLPESQRRTSFVGLLREGELTRDRVSTVDVLDSAAGLAATVLALEDAGSLRLGHYGVAPGAARLLPGTEPET
ncbi:MAG: copper transporter [Actinomycetota bacterium]